MEELRLRKQKKQTKKKKKNKLNVEELLHRKNIDQLLHDKSFILWCLFPTEESDKQWKENYLSLYPEEAETLMLA